MIVSIDVGGTFTDCLVQEPGVPTRAFKVPTTPRHPADGVLQVLGKAAAFYRKSLPEFVTGIELLVHGTTLATNALLERKGAKVGMLTTWGFRDILELRRGFRHVGGRSIYDVFVPPYRPLVPRRNRLPITERTHENGQVSIAVDTAEVQAAVRHLLADGCESVAVCFLHSYANGANEREAAEVAARAAPAAHVVASHEILPVWGEFERFSTTVVSAYVGNIVGRYLDDLQARLESLGLGGRLLIVQADGHVQSPWEVSRKAVYLVGSGPAAAPTAGLYLGAVHGWNNLISVDVGGTSCDVCLVRGGVVDDTTEGWVGEERVAIKMRDVHTVGAGGGSIAWIDSLGLLRVGPQSAGADPGPACYAKGGDAATVTDAALILGYVPSDYFLGGEIPLDEDQAREALDRVGRRLGLNPEETAQAVFTTINSFMADQISEISTRRGYDVRDFVLVGGGGAGPMHAGFLAELLGIQTVIIPQTAGLYSALGMQVMDIGRDYARTYVSPAATLRMDEVNALFAGMEREALAAFRRMGISDTEVRFTRSADMRYYRQFHEIEVPLPARPIGQADLAGILEQFHHRHKELYTFAMPFRSVEFITFRLRASVPRRAEVRLHTGPMGDGVPAPKRERTASFAGRMMTVPVYEGQALRPGHRLRGPAIVEEATTTAVIPPGFDARVDTAHNYILTRGG